MRLFTGISLPAASSERIAAVMEELRPTAAINWTPPLNLHITCKFIGTWPDDRLPELQQALSGVRMPGSIPIEVSKFGFLPNPHRPRTLVAGVQAGRLADLARMVGEALEPLGCVPETRPYMPHVTVARIKPDSDIRGLRERIAAMIYIDFGSFETSAMHLYDSAPGQRSSVYSILATYDLLRE